MESVEVRAGFGGFARWAGVEAWEILNVMK